MTEDEKLEFQAAAEVSKANGSTRESVLQVLPTLPNEAGIEAVRPSLSGDLLSEYFLKAKELVRIQDNGLQDLLTYNTLFREMLKTKRPDLVIQILLLDPGSSLANIREEALNMPEKMDYLRQQIKSAIGVFKNIYEEVGSRSKSIELRLFDVLPSVQNIAFDDTIFIGFYSHTRPSQSAYQLQIRRGSRLGNFFEEDFEKVWDMAKQHPLD